MNWWIARNIIYRPVVAASGLPVFHFRKQFEMECHSSPEEVEDKRLQRLRTILSKHGIKTTPSALTLQCTDLLQNLIPQSKSQLQQGIKTRHSHGRWRRTSGSSGVPLSFPKDRISLAAMEAMADIFYGWHGCALGTPTIRVWGSKVGRLARVVERIRDETLNRTRISAFDLTTASVLHRYARALRRRPKMIVGYPSALAILVDVLRNAGVDTTESGISTIVTTGEMLFPQIREYLQEAFAARVVNEYGCAEVGIVGFECAEGRCHVSHPNVVVELANSHNKSADSEVLVTDLFDGVTLFLRYRLGDVAEAFCRGGCSCGIWWPWLEGIQGRQGDVIVAVDGRRMYSAALGYYFSRLGVKRFFVEQIELGKLKVFVDLSRDISWDHAQKSALENFLGGVAEVDLCPYEDRPPSASGKRGYFKGLPPDRNWNQR